MQCFFNILYFCSKFFILLKTRLKKLKSKFNYRLIFYNDSNYTEIYSVRLSFANIYAFISVSLFLILFVGFLVISTFTPLKYFIKDYQDNLYQKFAENTMKVEILEDQLNAQNLYINNLKSIINGEESSFAHNINYQTDLLKKYFENGLYKEQYLNNGKFSLKSLILYPPVKGIVIDTVYIHNAHYGIDIVTIKNASVSAVLDGTIIFADWTTHSGYVIYIQHDHNIISVYKHNSQLIKNVGSKIYAGDIIAFVGNTCLLYTSDAADE